MCFKTIPWVVCLGLMAVASVHCAAVASDSGSDPEFGSYWHDGKAELDGYRWSVTRYGQRRNGQAVLIYVTEPFSGSKRVKVNDVSKHPSDTFDALKLNFVRDFQTGIYDYNTMVSLFTRSDSFAPVKISFSSAEWCGHVYEQLRLDPHRVISQVSSYFEDESSSNTLDRPNEGVTEDNLFILLRGLRGPFLQAGQTRSVPFLPSAFYRRLTHRPINWGQAQIHRLDRPQTVKVPAGTFSTIVYRVTIAQERVGRFFVEQSYPHRIVQWSWQSPGSIGNQGDLEAADAGQLTGTARLGYWTLHDNGHEQYLQQLGLGAAVR